MTLVNHPFLQRNDRVVRDLNAFRANFCATFGDVAVADPLGPAQFVDPILRVEWMHLERGDVNQEPRPDKFIVFTMVAQHVANILAKKAFDALPKLLDPVDVLLLHSPGAIGRIGRTRLEWLDFFLYSKIPGYVRDQILDDRESLHRFHPDRLFHRQIA